MLINSRDASSIKMLMKNFKKDTDVEMYLAILINFIENRDLPVFKIKLEGMLRYHQRYCLKADICYC